MKLACAILIVALPFAVHAQMPVFENAQYVYANGILVDVGYYGSPFFYDWNGDGLKDLIVGQFTSGRVRVYLNSGSPSTPAYTTFTYLYADGSPISVYAS